MISPFSDNKDDGYIYKKKGRSKRKSKVGAISKSSLKHIMAANGLFVNSDIDLCNKFSTYGFINTNNYSSAVKEYIFFTKPDLNIFNGTKYNELTLNPKLNPYPIFNDAINRYKDVLVLLEGSLPGSGGGKNNFNPLLTNCVASSLDIPSISAEALESSTNLYGASISYRSHSIKSDNGGDFTLSFKDTSDLKIYHLVKLYDEFMRLQRQGKVSPKHEYIVNLILSEQFSVYKFLVSLDDPEVIKYWIKFTGVYFSDVPRSDFSDVAQDGFKYSLSFHYNDCSGDSDPTILTDFNMVNGSLTNRNNVIIPYYDMGNSSINNTWAKSPIVVKEDNKYKLKWCKTRTRKG